ncbi:ABC-2 type transport system permease protein [Psychrobacillus sp. OK028]|uniref:ABC transporter permease n=1 Tax=Psychrobacillus sp. OK028 TaxID=1884359 RepID=UPI0008829A89|nr:ABC transporter permease [Psychrobacillus sp. OK028]SDN39672.1 ABC-2 type transport system permease protein [Psychrobacillus sp. OK028]
MKGIWIARFLNLKRKPIVLIMMTIMTLVMASVVGGSSNGKMSVAVAVDDSETTQAVLERLKKEKGYSLLEITEEELQQKAKEDIRMVGIGLKETSYTIYSASDSDGVRNLSLIVESAYRDNSFKQQVIQAGGDDAWAELEVSLNDDQAFLIQTEAMDESEVFRYDNALQSLFGFMLFFVFYTVAINVQFILDDKRSGVWNRLKLASVSRFQLYFGHLSFSYIIGLVQVLLVLFVFRYVLGTNMYDGFWKVVIIAAIYVLLVMAFSVFVISLVKTVSQSSIIISLVAVAFAMIGGAYWPLEIVQSEGLLAMKWISPIYYAMESMKRVTVYEGTLSSVGAYVSMMIVIAIVLIVVGISLLEKRTERYHSSE